MKKEMSKRQMKKEIKQKGSQLVHNDEELGVTVRSIKTRGAARFYGAGTKWCVSARDDKSSFADYRAEGYLYIIQHKKRKYMFHIESCELRDEENCEVNFYDMHTHIPKSLAKSKNFNIKRANFMWRNPYIRPYQIERQMKTPNPHDRLLAIKHPNATKEIYEMALNDSNFMVKTYAEVGLKRKYENEKYQKLIRDYVNKHRI